MKLNKKGFMMAEVIVVSSIVLITLTSLYMSYNKIYSTYKKRINYYDVSIIYDLDKIRRNVVIDAPTNNTKIDSESNTTVYAIPLTGNKITDTNLSQENTTFNEYLEYLKNSITVNNCNYILVMEKCDEAKKECKYGYLESKECIK
ncbi:MAG: hypothetical protein PUB90_01415 [bacterium]|nr:hypothetical protein [bacterium]